MEYIIKFYMHYAVITLRDILFIWLLYILLFILSLENKHIMSLFLSKFGYAEILSKYFEKTAPDSYMIEPYAAAVGTEPKYRRNVELAPEDTNYSHKN